MAYDYNAGLEQGRQAIKNAETLGSVLLAAGKLYGDYKSMQNQKNANDYISVLTKELNNPNENGLGSYQNYQNSLSLQNGFQNFLNEQNINSQNINEQNNLEDNLKTFTPELNKKISDLQDAQFVVQANQGIVEQEKEKANVEESLNNLDPNDPKYNVLDSYKKYLQAEIDAANYYLDDQKLQDNFRKTAYDIGMSVLTGNYNKSGKSGLSMEDRLKLKEVEFQNKEKYLQDQIDAAYQKGYMGQSGRNQAEKEFLPVKSSILLKNQKEIEDYKANLTDERDKKLFDQKITILDYEMKNRESTLKKLEENADAQSAADMVQEVMNFVSSDKYPELTQRYGEKFMNALGVSSEYTNQIDKLQQILTTKTKAILGDGRYTENEAKKIQERFGLKASDDKNAAMNKLRVLKEFLTPKKLTEQQWDGLFKKYGIERDKKTTSQPVKEVKQQEVKKESKKPENKLTNADFDAMWQQIRR